MNVLINIDGIIIKEDVALDYPVENGELVVDENDSRIAGFSSIIRQDIQVIPEIAQDITPPVQ